MTEPLIRPADTGEIDSDDLRYPSIMRRYMATVLDGILLISVFFAVSYLIQGQTDFSTTLRVGITLFLFFVYEPLCTSKFCTVGQGLMGIRVRGYGSFGRRSIPDAYVRIIVKGFLGIISFLSMPFNKDRRGIHDFAARSIVLRADDTALQ